MVHAPDGGGITPEPTEVGDRIALVLQKERMPGRHLQVGQVVGSDAGRAEEDRVVHPCGLLQGQTGGG
jgi:hypothetical protein